MPLGRQSMVQQETRFILKALAACIRSYFVKSLGDLTQLVGLLLPRESHGSSSRGRVGSTMELSAGCRVSSPGSLQRSDRLTHVFTCLLTGSCPRQTPADVAGVIFSGVCGHVPGEDRECAPVSSAELSCIGLTVVERISSDLTSCSLTPELSVYWEEILTEFQHMELMAQLIQQFQSEDQIISHLAAKSASSLVFYQLLKSGAVSPVWQQKCVQTFCRSAPGPELDACLWSLTEVLKRLLKGAHQDIFGKLLAALDSSVSVLCSKFLPEDRAEMMQYLDVSSSGLWGATICLLLDLLEVLTASSLTCGAGVCLKSQRITHIHSSALLTTISCCSQYFVKKRALLLLKRAALQKAGEEWALGEPPSAGTKHEDFDSDMSLLARSVLTAASMNWLQSVQVESASFFGGTRRVRGDEGQKPDCVMLRAASLLLLKSLELHVQTAAGTGVDGATEVSGYLQGLWDFLRQCSVQLTEVAHRCCWISVLFGEQDDDMMEAAKACLSIFLHHRRCSGFEVSAVLKAACASGCNPHCHFLLLLQSISFDHSILLDFLISTETCFLEYFVRYLKCLTADWPGFTAACGRIGSPGCRISPQMSLAASCSGDNLKGTDGVEFSSCDQPSGVISEAGKINSAAGFHLVDYDSSDESDTESMEVSQHEALDEKQEMSGPPAALRRESSDSTGLPSEPKSTLERGLKDPSLQVMQTGQTSRSGPQVTCRTLTRAVLCMSALRDVVTRLQTKKLFPYNPSSLLKLLAQVENCF